MSTTLRDRIEQKRCVKNYRVVSRPEHDPRLIARRLMRGGRERFRVAVWMIQAEHYLREPDDFVVFLRELYRWMQSGRHPLRKINKALNVATGEPLEFFLPDQETAVKP